MSSQYAFNHRRFRQLVIERCNGTLDEQGVEELCSLLNSSNQARLEYRQLMILHSQLQGFGSRKIAETRHVPSPCDAKSQHRVSDSLHGLTRSRIWNRVLAASLLLAVVGGSYYWKERNVGLMPALVGSSTPNRMEITPVVARAVPLAPQTDWSLGRPGGDNLEEVKQGDTLWLKRGALELKLANDTTLLLHSPIIMQIVSVDRVRVMDGSIQVEVAEGGEGFTVESDSAEVIDLGTSFSVSVREGNTDLVVFDGKVDLKTNGPANGSGGPRKPLVQRFHAGEAVHVTKDGTLSRIYHTWRPSVGAEQSAQQDSPLISAVTDNIVREDFYSFYEIIINGMAEDALAFVDRANHEWNGVTEAGMPAYLLRGDLVRTFNDDKVSDELEVQLTLTRPADVYVLLDERLAPPQWLLDAFVDTGDFVGLDSSTVDPERSQPEGGWKRVTGVGPGVEIDRAFSVWRSESPQSGVVRLGPNGRVTDKQRLPAYRAQSNMYGVVVVPLDKSDSPK